MYTLTRGFAGRTGMMAETFSLVASLLIAELFYKFHSFTLECVAFLATWWLIGGALSFLGRRPS
jgi:hypothetical protein